MLIVLVQLPLASACQGEKLSALTASLVKLTFCFGRQGIAILIQTSRAVEKTKVGCLFTEEELRQWFFRYMASSYSQPRRINP